MTSAATGAIILPHFLLQKGVRSVQRQPRVDGPQGGRLVRPSSPGRAHQRGPLLEEVEDVSESYQVGRPHSQMSLLTYSV